MGGPGSGRGARPGVYPHPLTKLEIDTLQMLAEGFKPRELVRPGEKVRAIYRRFHQIKLKLDAFTRDEMMARAAWDGIVTRPDSQCPDTDTIYGCTPRAG